MTDVEFIGVWVRTVATKLFLNYLGPEKPTNVRGPEFTWPAFVSMCQDSVRYHLLHSAGMKPVRVQRHAKMSSALTEEYLCALLKEAGLTEDAYCKSRIQESV